MANEDEISRHLTDSHRFELKDKAIPANLENGDWSNLQLTRLVAIRKRFKRIDFSNTAFDSCYLRDCHFDSCNFTGTKFLATNLHGAKFVGCIFDYATFEKTIIDDSVLSDNCPAHENQKMRFARTLRINYQQLGDTEAANHAIRIELDATEIHLRKAWKSNDHYYRAKYPGFSNRIRQLILWSKFKILDYVWGNGESLYALLRTLIFLIIAIAVLDLASNPVELNSTIAIESFRRSPQIFLGTISPHYISPIWLTSITVIRLIVFGLFISTLVKRFNRR